MTCGLCGSDEGVRRYQFGHRCISHQPPPPPPPTSQATSKALTYDERSSNRRALIGIFESYVDHYTALKKAEEADDPSPFTTLWTGDTP